MEKLAATNRSVPDDYRGALGTEHAIGLIGKIVGYKVGKTVR